ncbi:MAG: hypothetical protein WD557_16605 [Dehalococcoidia bacterium]
MKRFAEGLLCLVTAGLLLACSGGAETPSPDSDDHGDEQAEQSRKAAEMRATEEYQVAVQQITSCLAERGYVGNPHAEGMSMPDGTVLKLGPDNPGQLLRGAYLDYSLAQQDCQERAGFEAILQQHGLTSQREGVSPGQVAAINQQQLAIMRCMKDEGWEIPEPVTLRGLLVFDPKLDSAEDQAAWDSDYATCFTESRDGP